MRKISAKRARELTSSGLRLGFNSTIARKSCTAITAGEKLRADTIRATSVSYSALQSNTQVPTESVPNHAVRNHSKPNFGKRRKPISKQSRKQKARLQKLAAVRAKWWQESQASGKPLNCGICDEEIRTREELVSDHERPGTFRDDRYIQPAHSLCNQIKGSRRNFKIVRGDKNWKLIHGQI